jgi:SAM-dependent methyltransferase
MLKQFIKRSISATVARPIVLNSIAATVARTIVSKYRDDTLLPPIDRAKFVASVPTDQLALEIGPFDRPWLSGPTSRYFDVLSQDELRDRARIEPNRVPKNCPFIHYVSATGDLSIIEGEFGAVFSSHCVEHQPDLIKHLRDIERLLRPGGHYYLIVPDKRFCFDHFLPESTVNDISAAKGRVHHSEAAIEEHATGTTHNINILHWLGYHGRAGVDDPTAKARRDEYLERARAGEYVDVHAWQFTPTSFRRNLQRLFEAGEIGLEPVRVHDTGFARIEFMAVLRRAATRST